MRCRGLGLLLCTWIAGYVCLAAVKLPEPPPEPKLSSLHPFTGQRGTVMSAVLRGSGLQTATGVYTGHKGFTIEIEGSEAEPALTNTKNNAKNQVPIDLVRVRVRIAADAKPGWHLFRLITPRGLSNALPIYVSDQPVIAEPEGTHETPETAAALQPVPALLTGRLGQRGEVDYFTFDAAAGQTLTFEGISGLPSLGGPGGNANGFDPALSIYQPVGSWFDAKRVKRIAFNDEPLWVIGDLTNAHLVHTFETGGRYFLRVEAFSGQGGPDYSYQLKIRSGAVPPEPAPKTNAWDERAFERRLSASRLNELAERGGTAKDQKTAETYRGSADGTVVKLPATVEGALLAPGETHRAHFEIDSPQDIAFEVETPQTAPPLFNPIVRLLNAAGEEVATNVMAGRGACSGAMYKSIEAKTVVPLRNLGQYTVEVRETTSDLAEPGFRYRVMIRPQVPHIGDVKIEEDRVNLTPGDARTVRVMFDREENYRGAVVVMAESLPPGVEAAAGADFEPDKDPPANPGKRERYTPRTERSVVVLTAAADAAPMRQPQIARLVVRPVVDGKPGVVVATKEIPVMIVSKP